ncbi:hypothetical protein GSY69_06020 [Brevibacterium sp. 5221]|uniref:DoxX family membrane protein n=1 Tax=Brevibacterium rongguiense TaxID=2695267 RepID=A0A6N9H6Z8_9MICO|nr:hypothetical protein [Brevibacterium rongguiense]MYM19536.1 hypothetical protein [Brevibacterium rongguiense]
MSLGTAIMRGVTGAWILNSAYGKVGMDEETAKGMQGRAQTGIPDLKKLTPEQFKKFIIGGEFAVGGALLAPFIPNRLAGAVLGGFAAGMLSMYFRNPSMTESDGVRWTHDGTTLAKDMWLGAIAASLLVDGKK